MDRLAHAALDSIYALGSCFCSPAATVKLNGRTFKIVKLLGEGGFSYVYLAQDPSSDRLFALKKIRCPLGSDSVREALKEVEAYRRFRHPNIIRCLDSCVVQDKDGDGKVIYLFLPYYARGNLQDAVAAHSLNGTQFPERDLLHLFLGTCRAVAAMHHYSPGASTTYPPTGSVSTLDVESTTGLVSANGGDVNPRAKGKGRRGKHRPVATDDHDEDDEDEDGEVFGGAVPDAEGQERPLMGRMGGLALVEETGNPPPPGMSSSGGGAITSILDPHPAPSSSEGKGARDQPWAHRDLKPANVMLADDGQPILMDFGSAIPARVDVPTRSVALQQQDLAAEHSSMPYRAPELFDVKTGAVLTESTDVWSLGCLLFCLAYHHSPFESPSGMDQGGSMALAVMNGSWRFPAQDRGYSQNVRDLIKGMLVLQPDGRWPIDEVIGRTQSALERLS